MITPRERIKFAIDHKEPYRVPYMSHFTPTHSIQLDVPVENIEAIYSALSKYSNYPINC